MEPNVKLDYLKFIAQTQRIEFENRRKIEWKIVFSVLSFYILALTFKFKSGVVLPESNVFWYLLRFGFIIISLITIIFLKNIHLANICNRNSAHKAEHAIQAMLNGNDPFPVDLFVKESKSFRNLLKFRVWSWFWQSILILFFSILTIGIVKQ